MLISLDNQFQPVLMLRFFQNKLKCQTERSIQISSHGGGTYLNSRALPKSSGVERKSVKKNAKKKTKKKKSLIFLVKKQRRIKLQLRKEKLLLNTIKTTLKN